MNEYLYEDISIGQEEKFQVTVTQEIMDSFCKISGDVNPLHTDLAFAQESGYSSCVVYGMLTASYLSTLAGVYIPGKWCLLENVDTTFVKPVFVGDTLTIKGKVADKHDIFKRVEIKARIENQERVCVCRAKVKARVLK